MADDYRPLPGDTKQKFKQYEKSRDGILTAVINKVDVVKNKADTITAELTEQQAILDTANEDLERNNNQMKTLNDRMQDFLENTSNTCLYFAIAISGFIFLLLVSI